MILQTVASSFALVAVSEIGDKTQLLALTLSARFKKPWPIMAGIFVATVLNHGLASGVGQWVAAQINPSILSGVLALSFIAFGIWTLRPDQFEDQGKSDRWGPWATTLVFFFFAEMGDKTQMATVALAAKYQSALWVTFGTTLGMMVTDGVAVFLGDRIGEKVQMKWIRIFAASLFFLFGISMLFRV